MPSMVSSDWQYGMDRGPINQELPGGGLRTLVVTFYAPSFPQSGAWAHHTAEQHTATQPGAWAHHTAKQNTATQPHSHTARCLSSPPLTRLTPPCNTCLKTNISARMQMCTRSPFYQSHMPELTAPHHTTPAWRRPAQRCAPTHRRIRSPAHHRIRALEQGCIEH